MRFFKFITTVLFAALEALAIPALNALGFCFFWNWAIVGAFDVPTAEFKVIWIALIFARLFMIVRSRVEVIE